MLDRCLASVVAAAGPHDEVIVVDSASVDAEAVAAVVQRHGARLVRCDEPGVCRARNAGWRAGSCELVAFTDDDVVVDAAWLDSLVAVMTAHPEAAFVTGRIDCLPGQEGTDAPVAVKTDDEEAVFDASTVGDIGHNANMGVRRAALERIGGYDESLGAGGRFRAAPETDLFDRLFIAGFTGRYDPTVRACHDQWRGRSQRLSLDWRYGLGNGARLAKLIRSDRPRCRRVAREVVVEWGLRTFVRDVRSGYEYGALMDLARTVGVAVGFVTALAVPLESGHLHPRQRDRRRRSPSSSRP
jgi:glycosyltransferase involved in cell wall biosynthesis